MNKLLGVLAVVIFAGAAYAATGGGEVTGGDVKPLVLCNQINKARCITAYTWDTTLIACVDKKAATTACTTTACGAKLLSTCTKYDPACVTNHPYLQWDCSSI